MMTNSDLRLLGCVDFFLSLRLSGLRAPQMSLDTIFLNPVLSLMAQKIISKGKDKDVGESKSENPKSHRITSNKKLFLDLPFEEKHKSNRLGKVFDVVGWGNIVKAFNEKMG